MTLAASRVEGALLVFRAIVDQRAAIEFDERSRALQPSERSCLSTQVKKDFQSLWNYQSTAWAAKFLDYWCRQVMRSKIEPVKKAFLRTIQWFDDDPEGARSMRRLTRAATS